MIHYVKIENDRVIVNDELISISGDEQQNWKKRVYNHLELSYPKFFKMDDLSKLSILGTELLKRKADLDVYKNDEISLIFANKSGSTYTDNEYRESVKKGAPSPSLFVYTLPNICTGEIAIFNKWYGNNCFYIAESLNELPLEDLLAIEFGKGAKACLVGWVEKTDNEELGFFVFIEEQTDKVGLEKIMRIIQEK